MKILGIGYYGSNQPSYSIPNQKGRYLILRNANLYLLAQNWRKFSYPKHMEAAHFIVIMNSTLVV